MSSLESVIVKEDFVRIGEERENIHGGRASSKGAL
jgi:hypothetical protein